MRKKKNSKHLCFNAELDSLAFEHFIGSIARELNREKKNKKKQHKMKLYKIGPKVVERNRARF